jgi:hypothetical protein
MKIEVNVPDGMDLDHTYQAVMDAMYNADNVSKQEVLLVSSLLNQLASKKNKKSLEVLAVSALLQPKRAPQPNLQRRRFRQRNQLPLLRR